MGSECIDLIEVESEAACPWGGEQPAEARGCLRVVQRQILSIDNNTEDNIHQHIQTRPYIGKESSHQHYQALPFLVSSTNRLSNLALISRASLYTFVAGHVTYLQRHVDAGDVSKERGGEV
jgi:hypothetical protein